MRAIALAIIIAVAGVENAIRGENLADATPAVQGVMGVLVVAFLFCLVLGV